VRGPEKKAGRGDISLTISTCAVAPVLTFGDNIDHTFGIEILELGLLCQNVTQV
jgi:hypothetical protein